MLEVWDARLNARDATDHPPVALVVVVRAWVGAATAEVHVVSVGTIVPRSGPIAPVRATVVGRFTVHVAGIDEVVRI